jgi:hypothetical protein
MFRVKRDDLRLEEYTSVSNSRLRGESGSGIKSVCVEMDPIVVD